MDKNAHPAKAVAAIQQGFSCSQAVFSTFAEEMGLDRQTALKLSQALGGGMGHLGEVCGAVSGAFLAISLKYGRTRVEDLAARDQTYALIQELAAQFKARFGALRCPDLLGLDIGTAEGMRRAQEDNLFRIRCDEFVRAAAEIADELYSVPRVSGDGPR
jgi:C_GCAxxG_C_C family probable redox protein